MSLKIENVVLPSDEQWRAIIMGARNPLNSWHRSDSSSGEATRPTNVQVIEPVKGLTHGYFIGTNDAELMTRLRNAGTDHRKFMRMITVYLDITAPLYWWKEFDTYKVGTVANSCSTMHKIHAKEFTLEDFSHEHLQSDSLAALESLIHVMNVHRKLFINNVRRKLVTPKDFDDPKINWWQMIQLLPTSYNQKRTVMLNYEVLANMYKSRRNHKLDEWRTLCSWVETLPYHELITGGVKEDG